MGKTHSKRKRCEECKEDIIYSERCINNRKLFLGETDSITITLMGSSGVGKTLISLLLSGQKVDYELLKTIGLEKLELKKIGNHRIRLYDTSGDEKFWNISMIGMRSADFVFLVYDLTNKESFNTIKKIYNERIGEKIFIVVQNKIDLFDKSEVSEEEGLEFAKSINAYFWPMSAKELSVEEGFQKFSDIIQNSIKIINPKLTVTPIKRPTKKKKPVIYLYPEKEMNISVSICQNGNNNLNVIYLKFNKENTWEVVANNKGEIFLGNQKYPYLFWESIDYNQMNFSSGFIVKGENAAEFLEEKLTILGLNYKEKTDFITFWLPILLENKISICSFQFENYDRLYPLIILPKPDKIIRVFLAIKKINEEIKIEEQILSKNKRRGFTVIEWGGCNIN